MNNLKTQKPSALKYIWIFISLILVLSIAISYVCITNTNKILERAEKNHLLLQQAINQSRSGNDTKDNLEILIINQSARQLTDYSEILVKQTISLHNTIIIWAAILILITLIFIFSIFIESRVKFYWINEKGEEIGTAMEAVREFAKQHLESGEKVLKEIEEKEKRTGELYSKAEGFILGVEQGHEEKLEEISSKLQSIDNTNKEIKMNAFISTYNLYLQHALILPANDNKIQEIKKIIEVIRKESPEIPADKKHSFLSECYFYIGLTFYDQKNYAKALDAYNKSLEEMQDAVVYNNIGLICMHLQDFKGAFENFTKAIELDEDDTYYANRAFIYRKQNKLNEALEDYNRAIRLGAENALYYASRGDIYNYLGDTYKALQDYNKAIGINPENPEYYFQRACLYKKLKRYNTALEDYRHAIKLNPRNADYYSGRAEIYFLMEDIDKSLENYTTAINLSPENAKYYNERGKVYYSIDEIDEAMLDYNKAIDLDPNTAEYYDNRGTTYYSIDEPEEAISDYTKAISIKPECPKCYYDRGLAYLVINETQKALSDLKTCIDLDPDNQSEHSRKALIAIKDMKK